MNRGMRVIGWASAFALALAVTATAVGQGKPTSQEEVRIAASKVVTLRHGYSPTGIQNETVQLTERVSYGDLDLASSSGEAQLEHRIRDTAETVCKQLGILYPAGAAKNEKVDRQACVKGAVDGAMAQAKMAIAAAGEPTRR